MIKTKQLYDSFNARYLNNEEIANLFIINKQYEDLIKNNHSLLMGPRGSGKTTLLKMLTIPSQHFWNKSHNSSILEPSFIAVYVPTDVQWKKQMDDFDEEFDNKPKYKKIITRLIVTTNILISLCDTFINLLEFKNNTEQDLTNEAELSLALINDWKIKRPVSTNLSAIKHSLLNRLVEINSHVNKVKALDTSENDIVYPEYFFDDYLGLVAVACNSFERVFKDDEYFVNKIFKWALCFDELEIAPQWLQNELLGLLRSLSHQNILFKLTMVPLVLINKNSEFEEINARENQDFEIIRTWTYSKSSLSDWEDFSRRIVQDKFRRQYNAKINPLTLFGSDKLDLNLTKTFRAEAIPNEKAGHYTEGSLVWTLFKELAVIDKSFREFLISKKINPLNPVPLNDKQKDEIFRKVKPIAVHRYQFRSHFVMGRKRSRKNAALYYGLPFLYHYCDGNPRALIGLMDDFLRVMSFKNDAVQRIHISVQSRLVYNTSRKYLQGIYTHPDANVRYLNKYINLGALLDKIGLYFNDKIIHGDFAMDPANCFIVDKDVPEPIIELLKVAMHLGAIIYLDPHESVSKNGLIGKRFRLSYFLFPNYELPVVEYNDINLSKILKKGTDKIDQLLLFEAK